jgi:hypothetical protein
MTLIKVAPIIKTSPTPGDVHVNGPLTQLSVAFIQDADTYVADKVFPIVPVQKQSDLFYTYDKGDFLSDEARPRAPGTESAGGHFGVSTSLYSAQVRAYHKDIDDQLRANADSVLSLDMSAVNFVTQKMLISRERQFINAFFKTGVWGTDATPATLWSAAGSSPRTDVDAAKVIVQANTAGLVPNTLVITPNVLYALRGNAEIRDQFKYTSADSIDTAMMARYFGIERVLVLGAVYNSAQQGVSPVFTFMGGKSALLVYSAPAPSLMAATAGYIFAWTGYTGAVNGIRIKRFRMEHLESDRIEGQIAYDMRRIAAEAGYFFSNVVA